MKINKEKLLQLAVEENEEEKRISSDLRENRDLYKASMKIAMKIKRALRMAHLNQTQLALKMGMDPAVLSRLLSGKANLELKTIVRFEKELGITIIDRGISPFSRASQGCVFVNCYYVCNMEVKAQSDGGAKNYLYHPSYSRLSPSIKKYNVEENIEVQMASEPLERYSKKS